MNIDSFIQLARELFPGITQAQVEQFRMADTLYREWNAKINVISRKDVDGIYLHHFIHSLAIAYYIENLRPDCGRQWKAGASVIDIGTGGGFPGVPLAIMYPQSRFLLCDSIGKKILVAQNVVDGIGLSNVSCANARAESLPGNFDYVVSRAVTSLDNFYPWIKGRFNRDIFYLKGGDIAEELSLMMSRFKLRKGSVHCWNIPDWGGEGYFEGKMVVDIEK